MKTQEIAERLVELCSQRDYKTCYDELYSDKVVSIESDGTTCIGLDEMAHKGRQWDASIQELHSSEIGPPVVSGNYFSLAMNMIVTYKGAMGPVKFEEICIYHVKNGKIDKEQFFYDAPTSLDMEEE